MSRRRRLARGDCERLNECPHLRAARDKVLEITRELHEFRDRLIVETARGETMQQMLLTDPLTGAFNRNGLEKEFLSECSKAERFKNKRLFMLFFDIDNFKRFNNEHGERTGDLVLQEVVRAIEKCLRPYDKIFRIGGEEFIVLVPDMRSLQKACRIAERLRKTVEALKIAPHDGGEALGVTVSIGMARLGTGDSLDTLIDKANKAELEAKRTGKNRSCLYLGGEVLPVGKLVR